MAERKGFGKKALVFSLVLLLAGCRPAGVGNTAKPGIYITRTDHVRTLEGSEVFEVFGDKVVFRLSHARSITGGDGKVKEAAG